LSIFHRKLSFYRAYYTRLLRVTVKRSIVKLFLMFLAFLFHQRKTCLTHGLNDKLFTWIFCFVRACVFVYAYIILCINYKPINVNLTGYNAWVLIIDVRCLFSDSCEALCLQTCQKCAIGFN